MTETALSVREARAAWQEAAARAAAHPAYASAARDSSGPPEQWHRELAELELNEITARHAMERAEEQADPGPVQPVTIAAASRAIGKAIVAFTTTGTERDALHGQMGKALTLYGTNPAAEITLSERLRVEFIVTHRGIRAALTAGQDQDEASARLSDLITTAFERPGDLPAPRRAVRPPLPVAAPTVKCAAERCKRGPSGGRAEFAPVGRQKYCCHACRQLAVYDRAAARAAKAAARAAREM